MDKDAQTDLFPWILGGLLIAVAVPAVVAFTQPPIQPATATSATIVVAMTPTPSSPLVAATPPAPGAVSIQPSAPTPQATRPALPAGQVWQCIVNGQKVFSDSACGDGATIRQLGDVNGMDPTPVARAPLYAGYVPHPGNAPYPGYTPPPASYPGSQDQDPGAPSDVYAATQFVVIDRRREHVGPSHPHNHAPAHARY